MRPRNARDPVKRRPVQPPQSSRHSSNRSFGRSTARRPPYAPTESCTRQPKSNPSRPSIIVSSSCSQERAVLAAQVATSGIACCNRFDFFTPLGHLRELWPSEPALSPLVLPSSSRDSPMNAACITLSIGPWRYNRRHTLGLDCWDHRQCMPSAHVHSASVSSRRMVSPLRLVGVSPRRLLPPLAGLQPS